MPLLFSSVCKLLQDLEAHNLRDPPLLKAELDKRNWTTITQWFNAHQSTIHAQNSNGVAILSSFFPEKRTDRVYAIQEPAYVNILKRIFRLGPGMVQILEGWNVPGNGDLGQCVEKMMEMTKGSVVRRGNALTVEEVDQVLSELGRHRRGRHGEPTANMLRSIYGGLDSYEGKWLTRLILKDLSPVVLPERDILKSFHFLLPDLLKVQDSFDAAVGMLRTGPLCTFAYRPAKDVEVELRCHAADHIRTKLNVKVGRPLFQKAWSWKHLLQLVGGRFMSVQRKYDGEYCQIHIDLSRGHDCIKIFAKSGKDATTDRIGVHGAIRTALRIGNTDCRLKSECILDAELLVYSDKEKKITDFHKIRKYVSRNGVKIGTEMDSPCHDFEHLMVVFHDLILLDGDNILTRPFNDRYIAMRDLICTTEGRAQLAESQVMDFSKSRTSTHLRMHYSRAISKGWEGLVLKPMGEPYFSFNSFSLGNMSAAWIKVKKDYIQGLGDTEDFAVIGGSYDGREASVLGIKKLSWTSFHIGCLTNREEVIRLKQRPQYKEVAVVQGKGIPNEAVEKLNRLGYFRQEDYNSENPDQCFGVVHDQIQFRKMTHIFKEPFVVELMGAGFEKPPGASYFTLRFPRVKKIHEDRTFLDAVTFSRLQELAEEARNVPEDLREEVQWEWNSKLSTGRPLSQVTPSTDSYCTTVRSNGTTPQLKGSSPDGSALGRLMPWCDKISPTPDPRKSRKATPMVRIDSGEMKPGESRLANGDVVSCSPRELASEASLLNSELHVGPQSKKRKASAGILEADINLPVPPRKRFTPSAKFLPRGRESVAVATVSFPEGEERQAVRTAGTSPSSIFSRNLKKRNGPIVSPSVFEESTDDEGEIVQPSPKRPRRSPDTSEVQFMSSNPVQEPTQRDGTQDEQSGDYDCDDLDIVEGIAPNLHLSSGTSFRDTMGEGRFSSPIIISSAEPESQETIPSQAYSTHESESLSLGKHGNPRYDFESYQLRTYQNPAGSPELDDPNGSRCTHEENVVVLASRSGPGQPPSERPQETTTAGGQTNTHHLPREIHSSGNLKKFRSYARFVLGVGPEPQSLKPHKLAYERQMGLEAEATGNASEMSKQRDLPHAASEISDPVTKSKEAQSSEFTSPSSSRARLQSGSQISVTSSYMYSDIPSWYPHAWPASPDFPSKIPDKTLLYTLSYLSISTSALCGPLRREVRAVLDTTFPKTHHTEDLKPFCVATSVTFSNSSSQLPPLAKIALFDSQDPSAGDIFPRMGRRIIEAIRTWKARGQLREAGKIFLLDYRIVAFSAKLISNGSTLSSSSSSSSSFSSFGVGAIIHAPGPLEESREKREVLGKLWKENFFLGCVKWDARIDGDVRMSFDREECL